MKFLILSCLTFYSQISVGQKSTLLFKNHGQPIPFGNAFLYSNKIHEISLKPDSTFEFWSFPYPASCHTWRHYKGTWRKVKDTVVFSDNYTLVEPDTRATYNRDCSNYFFIKFKTDNNSELINKGIKIEYWYDFDSKLERIEREFIYNSDNSIKISFSDIPNFNQLASIKVIYLLNNFERRNAFLTESDTVNVLNKSLPNIIEVEFVEIPKHEVVHRTIKGIIKNGTLTIVSITKTKTTLPDYFHEIEFEDGYKLGN